MRRQMRVLAAVATLALVPACSSGSHNGSRPPATAPGPNPDVIPAVITPAYVDAVFKVLNHINGNAVRAFLAAGKMTPQVENDLRAIYGDPLYSDELRLTSQSLAGNLANVRRPPGDRVTIVSRLVDDSSNCIFVESLTSYSAVLLHAPPATASEYWRLSAKDPSNDPNGLNPTPWAMTFNASYTTPTNIPDQCGAS